MKRILAVLMISFLLSSLSHLNIHAAPPPEEVWEIKNEAPLHVVGTVTSDMLLQDLTNEKDYPNQLRKMELAIEQIIIKPKEIELNTGETLEIVYRYTPSWVAMNGGAKMDIMVGDQIEVWLDQGVNGWEPALGGSTVNHLKYSEPRKEPIPEPWTHWLLRSIDKHVEIVVFGGFLILSLLIIVISRKLTSKKASRT